MSADETELFWVRREIELLEFARSTGSFGRSDLDRYEELCSLERHLLEAS